MIFESFTEEYLEYAIALIPLLTQLGIPFGLTFLILLHSSSLYTLPSIITFILTISLSLLIADILAYFIGKTYGNKPLYFLSKKLKITSTIKKTNKLITKNSFYSILITRTIFLGGAPITNYILGIENFSLKKFIIYNSIAELLYVSIFASIGYIFKSYWEVIFSLIGNMIYIIIIIFFLYILSKHFLLNKES